MTVISDQEADSNARPEHKALPGEFYTSQEWFEKDLDKIFYEQWLFVGHGTELVNPGDFITYSVGTESIIVTRQKDGSVKAYNNVCRHRGTRVCLEERGNVKRSFVCPYHAWSYGLDGKLIGAPKMPSDFDKADYGLKEVWVEEFHTLIYVNFSRTQPKPVQERFADVNVELGKWQLSDSKVVADVTYDIEANWKLVSENFIECYHCTIVHPELCVVYDPQDSVVGERLNVPDCEESPTVTDTYHEFSIEGYLREGRKSLSMDGEFVVKRLMGDVNNPPMHSGAMYAFPNHDIGLLPDYLLTQSWIPTSPTSTRFRNTWSVHKDAVEGVDYNLEDVKALMDVTAREDLDVCALQDVVASRAYEPGPYHPVLEVGVMNWMRTYRHIHGLDD